MDIFFEPHRLLIQALIDFDIEFLLVGGYAVNLYGYNRPTGDLDLWLNPTDGNKQKLLQMLTGKEFEEESIAYISSLDFSQPEVFSMGEVPLKIDFLTHVNLVQFDSAYARKNMVEVDKLKVPFIHLNDLVLSKFNTGRLRDKGDIEELQKIQNAKTN